MTGLYGWCHTLCYIIISNHWLFCLTLIPQTTNHRLGWNAPGLDICPRCLPIDSIQLEGFWKLKLNSLITYSRIQIKEEQTWFPRRFNGWLRWGLVFRFPWRTRLSLRFGNYWVANCFTSWCLVLSLVFLGSLQTFQEWLRGSRIWEAYSEKWTYVCL